jgi:hypothetical protein
MAQEIKIAEIPIYGTDYETFHQKWERNIQKTVDEWIATGWERSSADIACRRHAFPQTVWQYAQVVGFLTISVSHTDVSFEVYAPVNERYRYNRKSRLDIQCWHTNGLHFPLSFPIVNKALRDEIYTWINVIKKDFLSQYYLDLSVFDAISNHLDYQALVNQLSKPMWQDDPLFPTGDSAI